MVGNLTKEVTNLKQDNALLKHELKNLHQVTGASPRLPPKYIAKEQSILPAELSRKDVFYVERVPIVALSTEALPAAAALTELSYRDVAAAGISPSVSGPLYLIVTGLKPLRRRQPLARLLLKFQLRGNLEIVESPTSVLAALYRCLSSGSPKGRRRCLSPVLAPKLLLMTFPKRRRSN
jgi:hypothetical protein